MKLKSNLTFLLFFTLIISVALYLNNIKKEPITTSSPQNQTILTENQSKYFESNKDEAFSTISEDGSLSKIKEKVGNATLIKIKKSTHSELEPKEEEGEEGEMNPAEKAREAAELERLRTLDPALGYVPLERRQIAIEKAQRMQQEMLQNSEILRGSLQKARWIERGPGNVGGRTKAFLSAPNIF